MQKENRQMQEGANETWKERILGILKGALISIGALLPGISGGALCVILGIYKRIMALLCHPIQEIKKQWKFFIFIGIGFVIGILLGAKVIDKFLEANEAAALFLFIGLIVGSMPGLFKEAPKTYPCNETFFNAVSVRLEKLLDEMYDTSVPFRRTGDETVCQYCDFKTICGK